MTPPRSADSYTPRRPAHATPGDRISPERPPGRAFASPLGACPTTYIWVGPYDRKGWRMRRDGAPKSTSVMADLPFRPSSMRLSPTRNSAQRHSGGEHRGDSAVIQ